MNLNDFMARWNGKLVPSRGGITGQCLSLVQAWAESNGVPGSPVFPVAGAKDMGGTRPDYFTWTKNSETGVPSPGDIIVWNGTWGGGWGHTGIVTSANVNSFQSYEQNNPAGSGAHIVNHPNYNGVIGWLSFKNGGTMADIVTTDELRIIHSELEGWPLDETHQGKFDSQFNASWGGQPLRTVLWDKWNKNGAWRARRQAALAYYDQKATHDAKVADLNKKLADVTKQYQDLLNKPQTPVTPPAMTEDQAVAVVQEKVNPLINFLRKVFSWK